MAFYVSSLCINAFTRFKFRAVFHISDAKLLEGPGPFFRWKSDDWKNWFLLPGELDTLAKYDGAIRALEYACSLSNETFADLDSAKSALLYLGCEKLTSVYFKVSGSFREGNH